jgi:hypothetical protein
MFTWRCVQLAASFWSVTKTLLLLLLLLLLLVVVVVVVVAVLPITKSNSQLGCQTNPAVDPLQ